MPKFDPLQWNEVSTNVELKAPQGRLWLRLSEDACVYVSADGVETLAGFGREVDAKTTEEMTFRVDGDCRAFLYSPFKRTFDPVGEVYTNADRLPMESGTMAEITSALRLFKLEQREIMREVKAARAELDADLALRRPKAEPEPDPETEGETPPEPEAEPEPKPEPKKSGK